ncbi:MAG: polymer-forming cytoskeletal protein [Rhodospirillales bacterium]|nr:polymer-forming cytoskeletal protein [Rhodospirillales bacterium]
MMFKPNRETAPEHEAAAPTAPAAKVAKGKVQHSIIGHNVTITGELHSTGDIMVHGTVEGSITCRSLTLGESPTVSSVKAETVRISGDFSGEIEAKEVILSSQARVSGNIRHDSLSVEPGASIEGRLSRLTKPKDSKARPKRDKSGTKQAEDAVIEPPAAVAAAG